LKQPPIEGWTASKLVQILFQRNKQFHSLRTLAQVNYRGPEGRQGFQEVVVVQRPDRLRLETLSGLGAILVVTANANQLAGFHPREGVFIRGKPSKENLFRYTRIPLELGEITALLLGLPPITSASDWQIGGNSLYREIEGKGKEIVSFDPSREIPVRWYRLAPDGTPELSAAFDNFSSTPAGLFPLKISLEAAGQHRVLEITYQEPELNAAIPPELFSQQKPANAKELPIEAIGS
jgi:outer membrane lipoprotein-sorting protein